MMGSTLDLISLPIISHHPLVLVDLPYERLNPVPGVIPLPLGRPQILPNILPTGPSNFLFPNTNLLSCLHKVQYRLLPVGVCVPLSDIDPLHFLGPVPQVPCQIVDVPQVPLIPLSCTLHILLHLLSPKYLLYPLPHISFY